MRSCEHTCKQGFLKVSFALGLIIFPMLAGLPRAQNMGWPNTPHKRRREARPLSAAGRRLEEFLVEGRADGEGCAAHARNSTAGNHNRLWRY